MMTIFVCLLGVTSIVAMLAVCCYQRLQQQRAQNRRLAAQNQQLQRVIADAKAQQKIHQQVFGLDDSELDERLYDDFRD